MTNCEDLIEHLRVTACDHIRLTMTATVDPVAAMHLDLALLRGEQVRAAQELCDEE